MISTMGQTKHSTHNKHNDSSASLNLKHPSSSDSPSPTSSLAFFLGLILIGLLIQICGTLKADRLVFPSVLEILNAFFRLLGQGETYAKIATTLGHLILALLLSSVIGLSLGLLQGANSFIRNLLKPLMIFLRSIPMIVLVVIIMVLTRYENVPLVATTIFLIPLISEPACQGYISLSRDHRDLLDVARLESCLNPRILRLVHLPLMAGYLRQAYITAAGMGMKMLISSEYLVQARNSLGKAIHTSSYFNDYPSIYAYALLMILLILLTTELPSFILRSKG